MRAARNRAATAGAISMPSRIRSLVMAAASRGSRNCSAAFAPSARRSTAAAAIPLRRLDSRAGHVSGDQGIDSTALGPKLIAFVQKTHGLGQLAGFVEQFAEKRTGQACGV